MENIPRTLWQSKLLSFTCDFSNIQKCGLKKCPFIWVFPFIVFLPTIENRTTKKEGNTRKNNIIKENTNLEVNNNIKKIKHHYKRHQH